MSWFLSLLSGSYLWIWHWGHFAARKWQEGSSLTNPETWGECFPRYTFSITRFFPSVILHNTYLSNVFLRICVFSLSLPRLSQQHRVQPPPPGRGSSPWRFPPSRGRQAPLQGAAAAARPTALRAGPGPAAFTPQNVANVSAVGFGVSSLQLSRVVCSGRRGELSL